jgi:hypothetical protein
MSVAASSPPKFFEIIPRFKFNEITVEVIKELEGGYYHPNMLQDGRVKDPKGFYSGVNPKTGEKIPGITPSGETMYGIDRVNGLDLRKNTPQEWDEFFKLLGEANAHNTWRWNTKKFPQSDSNSKTKNSKLLELASSIIYPEFNRLSTKYFEPEAYSIVTKDPRLLFHMAYAVWNGPGWFKKYARFINKEIFNGDKDPDSLANKSVDLRIKEGYKEGSSPNALISQTAVKIKNLIFPRLLNKPTIYQPPAIVNNQTKKTQVQNKSSQQETTLYTQMQQPKPDTTSVRFNSIPLPRLTS